LRIFAADSVVGMTSRMFVIEIARIYADHTVPVGQRKSIEAETLVQAISLAKDMMTSTTWPLGANGFRVVDCKGEELYRYSD
jgi:hypothetical protein